MADENQEQQEQATEATQGVGASTAAKAAAAAAATGVAAIAAKKALSNRGNANGGSTNGDSPKEKKEEGDSLLNSVLSGGWEAARDALLPAAEDAAGAAGEYVAQHGPDILRERIVPRFVEGFTGATKA